MVIPGLQDKEVEMFYPPEELQTDAHVPDFSSYLAMYKKSIEDPDGTSANKIIILLGIIIMSIDFLTVQLLSRVAG